MLIPFDAILGVISAPFAQPDDHNLLTLGLRFDRLIADFRPMEAAYPAGLIREAEFTAATAEIHDLADQIVMIRPRTLFGLAVKARATAWRLMKLWDEPLEALDPQQQTARTVVECCCAIAGVSIAALTRRAL